MLRSTAGVGRTLHVSSDCGTILVSQCECWGCDVPWGWGVERGYAGGAVWMYV